jgi:hypothetical protein
VRDLDYHFKNKSSQVQGLSSIILATWEAEIRRIVNSRPARANSSRDPISTNNPGMVVHTCHTSYMESINRRITVQTGLGMKVRPYSKITKAKRLEIWLN